MAHILWGIELTFGLIGFIVFFDNHLSIFEVNNFIALAMNDQQTAMESSNFC
jgi:hypothetical protein